MTETHTHRHTHIKRQTENERKRERELHRQEVFLVRFRSTTLNTLNNHFSVNIMFIFFISKLFGVYSSKKDYRRIRKHVS